MNKIRWYGPSLVLIAAVVLTMWFGPTVAREIAWAQQDARIQQVRNLQLDNASLAELSEAYRNVAQIVEPSVVHIEILGKAKRQNMRGNPFDGTPFEDFFEDRVRPRQQPRDNEYDRYNPQIPQGNGSGWVYDDAGHIITNHHVIANASRVRVTMFDGSKYEAVVVGSDPLTDIAVIKVDVDGLHPSQLATQAVEPGEIVFAFGSPFGFSFSMSQGIISGKGRELGLLSRQGGYENFIQTDAAINPGNSGGPLTNIYGEVVGMNSAIATRSGGFMGIGFAIPIDMVRAVSDQLIGDGHVSRGFLGIHLPQTDLDRRLAKTFGFEGKGVLIEDAVPGGAAAEAGLRRGDIITRVEDEPIETIRELRSYIAGMAPGTTIEVEAFRPSLEGEGETLTFDVTLGELPGANTISKRPPTGEPEPANEQEDLALESLRQFGIESIVTFEKQHAERLQVEWREGVIIESVREGSLAAPAGAPQLRRGMLITRIMGTPIASADELLTELAKHDLADGARISVAIWDREDKQWQEMFWLVQVPRD